MLFDGFTDIRGSEDGIEEDFNSNPQLKLDIGKFVGYPSIFYAGIEYYHWNNKYGIRGIKERVFFTTGSSALLILMLSFACR